VEKGGMGIKFLNRFLREECKTAIKMIPVLQLSGKKIAVDISIYLYKYSAENCLMENMYLMLSIFRYYQMVPVFIFDGKPPNEKKELLQKRRENKKTAEQEYFRLKAQLISQEDPVEEEEKQEIQNQIDLLKKQFISLKKETVEEVKQLMRAFGATYYDAPGEADELCAALVIKNKVWACLSEDMDLFVYGCPRVLRYFSLLNHTMVLYDLVKILDQLGMNQNELRDVCVLSGTDYNMNVEPKKMNTLHSNMALFKKYRMKRENKNQCFYHWLHENTELIQDYELLYSIKSMFECNSFKMKIWEEVRFQNGPFLKEEIYEILKKDGFLF
jgi:flap endonuclease-1